MYSSTLDSRCESHSSDMFLFSSFHPHLLPKVSTILPSHAPTGTSIWTLHLFRRLSQSYIYRQHHSFTFSSSFSIAATSFSHTVHSDPLSSHSICPLKKKPRRFPFSRLIVMITLLFPACVHRRGSFFFVPTLIRTPIQAP